LLCSELGKGSFDQPQERVLRAAATTDTCDPSEGDPEGRFLRLPTRFIEAISAAPKNVDERSSKCRLF
jgi:hypothetical protein